MTIHIQNADHVTNLIDAQERELQELLIKVMKSPLQPLERQAVQFDKRLEEIEKITKINLSTLQRTIREQGEEMKKGLKGLRSALVDELTELLTTCLASMPQEVTRLLQGQTSAEDLLGEVLRVQVLQGKLTGDAVLQNEALLLKSLTQMDEINNSAKTANHASEKAVALIDETSGQIGKDIYSLKAEGRLGVRQLDDGITALTGSLTHTGAEVADLALTLARRTDDLGSRLEIGFTSFREQSEIDRDELSKALQIMQKRFLWLSVLCGLTFAGAAGLVISRLIFHV